VKMAYAALVGIVCQKWNAARTPVNGLITGLELGLMVGIAAYLPEWLSEESDTNFWNFIVELIKFTIIIGLTSLALVGIFGYRPSNLKEVCYDGDPEQLRLR